MPVFFYIDPDIETDPFLKDTNEITLSYTFFESKPGLQLPTYNPAVAAHNRQRINININIIDYSDSDNRYHTSTLRTIFRAKMGKTKNLKFAPPQVRGIAVRYCYSEIPLKAREASYMLSFEHQNMKGCGGTESNSGHVRIRVSEISLQCRLHCEAGDER